MNRLIRENVNWNRLDALEHSAYECVIQDAYIARETGFLHVVLGLNFIVPWEDERHLKQAVVNAMEGLPGAKIEYRYDREHMALSEEDIIRLYLPRLLALSSSSLRNAVNPEEVSIREDEVILKSFSELATGRLNREMAPELSAGLNRELGIRARVRFCFDEECRPEPEKEVIESYAAEDSPTAGLRYEDPVAPGAPWGDAPAEEAPTADQLLEAMGGMPAPEEEGQNITEAPFDLAAEVRRPKTVRRKAKSKALRPGSEVGNPDLQPVFGRRINGVSTPLKMVNSESGHVIVEGIIFHIETKPIKNNKVILTILITDKKGSTCLKSFMKNEKWETVGEKIHEGDYIVAEGDAEFDKFERAVDVMVRSIWKGTVPKRQDHWKDGKRVELHCHTKMSAMDGLNEPDQIVKMAAAWGQPGVAITDHGVVQSFPDAANTAEKLAKKGTNIKVLYGMEGYVFDDRDCIREDGSIEYKKKPTNHIILLVRTQEGMKNLYKLVSISHLQYFYKRPRLPKSVLARYREGLIIGSACEAGEVYRAIERGDSPEELEELASFYDYLEIQPRINNRFLVEKGVYTEEQLLENNRKIVELGEKLGKPVVATTDAHYSEPDAAIYRNILLYGMGFKDAENGQGLYLRTTDEMMEEFAYLGEEKAREVVIENTNRIMDMVDEGIRPVPKEKCPPKIDGAEEELENECYRRAKELYGDPLPPEIEERLTTELTAIISNGYAVMYVSAQRLVAKSNADGYLVGSRGSVGSSFAATMAGITEVNPLPPHYVCPKCKHLEWGDPQQYDNGIDMPPKACPDCGTMMKRDGFGIPFATFLGFKGNKEPDIDLNFAGEYQPRAHKYVGVIFGQENVFKAGTVGTIAEKTAYGYVRRFFEETGRPANKYEIDRLTAGCTGVKRTTGQHPGGIIIVPRDHEIYEFCPVQHPANDTTTDIVTTHFDYHKIDQNLLKLDILGHNVPSMIRQLQDMTGIDPMEADLTDEETLSIFNGIEALKIKDPDYRFRHGTFGIPEFGTSFVRQMLDDVKPSRFEDLIRMSGFSHGTDVWLNNAQDYIREGVATMREVISTRDDIMNFCMLHGIENETSFRIMEETRKKNLVLTEEHKQEMRDHGIPQWYIDSCAKIKYMFPRAHAVAYVMMSFRMAWYKVHYPVDFYATFFTSALEDFDADTILKGKEAILQAMDNVKAKGNEATAKEKSNVTIYELAYEMYCRGYEFLPAKLGVSEATRFWKKDGKVLLPFAAYDGVGAVAARDLVRAYEEKPFDTVEDCANRARLGKGVIDTLRSHGVFEGLPETDQICWAI